MNAIEGFIDTNILVYAFDQSEPSKNKKAVELFEKCQAGRYRLAVSTQILSEFVRTVTKKIPEPLTVSETQRIVEHIIQLRQIPVFVIQPETILAAIQCHDTTGVSYWDCLIAETAKANGVYTILTENTKDFSKISGLKAKNPFQEKG